MCTVSWVHQPGGYHLLCNRDEKRTRGTAAGPADPDARRRAVHRSGGFRLRRHVDRSQRIRGRGVLIEPGPGRRREPQPGAAAARTGLGALAAECLLWLKQLDLHPFAGFSLLLLAPAVPATLAEWDGERLTVDPAGDAHMPLTSSSYDAAGVRRARLNEFARHVGPNGRIDSAALYRFHTSHGPSADAYSTCMHRDDAETVSFSWVTVTRR